MKIRKVVMIGSTGFIGKNLSSYFSIEKKIKVSTINSQYIAAYKADLECWFAKRHYRFFYIQLIILTLIVVIARKSLSIFNFFNDLPSPSSELKLKFQSTDLKKHIKNFRKWQL